MKYPKECPMCGAIYEDGFTIWAMDRVIAHQSIEPNGDMSISPDSWGVSEPLWETAETDHYFCGKCMNPLPEEMQRELDKALQNRRNRQYEDGAIWPK